jgi:hypothetical protein
VVTEPLTVAEIEAEREDHSEYRAGPEGVYCNECDYEWPCPTMRLLATLDAARERPSALDVEALAFIRALLSSPVWPADEDIPVPRAILTRLTKPDAGEGTER